MGYQEDSKKSSGCMRCKRALTPSQLSTSERAAFDAAQQRQGANYYCRYYDRPVQTAQGYNCPEWVDDRR